MDGAIASGAGGYLAGLVLMVLVLLVVLFVLWVLLPLILMRTNKRLDKTNALLADVLASQRRIEAKLQPPGPG
jgi:competence protein ComGC